MGNEVNLKQNDKKYGRIILILVILFVAFIIFAVFKKLTKKETVDYVSTQNVNVTHLNYGTIEKEISVSGIVQPVDNSTVTAKCSGELINIYVKNGDEVKAGDPICEIDNKKAIDAAKLTFEQAKNTFERYDRLYRSGNLSRQSYEDYKTSYERAKLEYDTQIEYSIPTASIDGIIDGMELNLNTMISNGKTICNINSDGLNEIRYGVSERVLQGIKLGDYVQITRQGMNYDGEVISVSHQTNQSTGQFDVKAFVKTANNFASGIMVKCTFIYDRKDNISYLNRNIVYYEGEEAFVYTVKDDNTIEKKFIKTGIENNENIEVVSGIDDNTKIISTWSNDLADGALVKINKEEKGIRNIVNIDDRNTVNEVAEETLNTEDKFIEKATNSEIEEVKNIEKATNSVIEEVKKIEKATNSEIEEVIDIEKATNSENRILIASRSEVEE